MYDIYVAGIVAFGPEILEVGLRWDELEVKVDVPDGVHPLLEALYYFFALINLMCNMAPCLELSCQHDDES